MGGIVGLCRKQNLTLMVTSVLLLSVAGWCADRDGTFDRNCHPTTFVRLHAQRGAKNESGPEGRDIVLIYSPFDASSLMSDKKESDGWHVVEGKLCLRGSSQCEALPTAKVRFDSNSLKRRLSGDFKVDFGDGRHEEGRFMVKWRHLGPRAVCM